MTYEQVIASRQVEFKAEIELVKVYLRAINVVPLTDIWIYRDYPYGWHAVVGANNNVYVLNWDSGDIYDPNNGSVYLASTEPMLGFYPNGALIRR